MHMMPLSTGHVKDDSEVGIGTLTELNIGDWREF